VIFTHANRVRVSARLFELSEILGNAAKDSESAGAWTSMLTWTKEVTQNNREYSIGQEAALIKQ
jgi:hypothetical protein